MSVCLWLPLNSLTATQPMDISVCFYTDLVEYQGARLLSMMFHCGVVFAKAPSSFIEYNRPQSYDMVTTLSSMYLLYSYMASLDFSFKKGRSFPAESFAHSPHSIKFMVQRPLAADDLCRLHHVGLGACMISIRIWQQHPKQQDEPQLSGTLFVTRLQEGQA